MENSERDERTEVEEQMLRGVEAFLFELSLDALGVDVESLDESEED